MAAPFRVEIMAGRDGHPLFVQQRFGEGQTVLPQMGYIGVNIKTTVRRRKQINIC